MTDTTEAWTSRRGGDLGHTCPTEAPTCEQFQAWGHSQTKRIQTRFGWRVTGLRPLMLKFLSFSKLKRFENLEVQRSTMGCFYYSK